MGEDAFRKSYPQHPPAKPSSAASRQRHQGKGTRQGEGSGGRCRRNGLVGEIRAPYPKAVFVLRGGKASLKTSSERCCAVKRCKLIILLAVYLPILKTTNHIRQHHK